MRITRLKEMGAGEIGWRLGAAAERAYDRARVTVRTPRWDRGSLARILAATPHLSELRAAAVAGEWNRAHDAIAGYFLREPQRFVIGAALRSELTGRIRRACPGSVAAARESADRMLAGRYDVLGYRDLTVGPGLEPIDWHYDPVNNRRAQTRFWAAVPYLDPGTGDHKVIWEINRHQHWLRLGRAYWLTGDGRYRDEVLRQLASWIRANPPLLGINWASMLELAFRSLSWIWTIHFLVEEPHSDADPWLVDLLVALDRQLDHVERNLSHYFSPNTHLLGEALALYVAGRTLPLLSASDRRTATGRRVLLEELDRQIASDGGHREQSTHYLRYTLDFYLLALAVARVTADPSQHEFARAVERLGEATVLLADDGGRLPHIGDDDGGMALPIAGREVDDVRDSLAIAGALVDRPDFRIGETPEEAFWMLGHPTLLASFARAQAPPAGATPPRPSGALRETGYYVSRSPRHHLVLDGGQHGYLNGGHAHADALSMTLGIGGTPFLIDPGTGSYTWDSALRERLRSTALHNTVTVDGRSQSLPRGPFGWSRTAVSTVHRWCADSGMDYFEASHDGYAPMSHRRHVLVVHDDLLVVADLVTGDGTHETMVHWHVDPRWRVIASEHRAVFTCAGMQVDLTIPEGALQVFAGETAGLWLGWHAPVYGRVEPASTLRIRLKRRAPTWVLSVFGLNSANAVRTVTLLPLTMETLENPLAVRVSRVQSTDLLVIATPARASLRETGFAAGVAPRPRTWRVGDVESDAQVLFVRTAAASASRDVPVPVSERRTIVPAAAGAEPALHRNSVSRPGGLAALAGMFRSNRSCAE